MTETIKTTETKTDPAATALVIDDRYVAPVGSSSMRERWGERSLRSRLLRVHGLTLHMPAETTLPKRYGKRIKAVGGHYSDIRGSVDTRYVRLPLAAAELIDELLADYGPRKAQIRVYRDHMIIASATLAEILGHLRKIVSKFAAVGKDYRLVTHAELIADDARAAREEHNYNCKRLQETVQQVIKQADTIGLMLTARTMTELCELAERARAATR